jgi:hypothetical protein
MDEEIFEGLDHAYKHATHGKTRSAAVLKSIFLSALVINGADLTTGSNAQRYLRLTDSHKELAMDFNRGIMYYLQVYGKGNRGGT